ncbi:MAG TPA: hypothetical protein VKG78_00505 [Opitutaceae bacterium]|nr:hypothetical protein [Opitutaceae bacterium]
MTNRPSLPRPWWRCPGPLVALGVHAVLFLGLYPLHFTDDEAERIDRRIEHRDRTREWVRSIVEEKGPWGLVIWFFNVHEEVRLYHRYAEVALRGADPNQPADDPRQGHFQPYRDVPVEYPPGALAFIIPPALFARDFEGYCLGFTLWMGIVYVAALGIAIAALGGSRPPPSDVNRALWWSVCFLLAFGGIVAARFDAAVALVCAAGIWVYAKIDRPSAGPACYAFLGFAAACGVLVKIVPGALLPAVLLCLLFGAAGPRYRQALALLGGFLAGLAALNLLACLRWGRGYLESYRYHMARGTQVESTYSGFLIAAHGLGKPYSVDHGFGSFNLVTPYSSSVAAAWPWLFLACSVLVAWRFWSVRGRGRSGPAAAGVLVVLFLLAFLLTNRVFSPQYMIWLGPLVAALCGFRVIPAWQGLVFLAATGLTQAIFPHLYGELLALDPAMVLVLNLRNLTVLALFAVLLVKMPTHA